MVKSSVMLQSIELKRYEVLLLPTVQRDMTDQVLVERARSGRCATPRRNIELRSVPRINRDELVAP